MTIDPGELPPDIAPDTKDWTWTVHQTCPECGFTAAEIDGPSVADRVPALTEPWQTVLLRPDVGTRPRPSTWSPLEYACHVRDVCRVFAGRARLMLERDAPEFANWDQDEAAVAGRYHEQDPARVRLELAAAADEAQQAFAAVPAGQWGRRGIRGNGAEFTLESLGQYFLHDLAHHLVDVGA